MQRPGASTTWCPSTPSSPEQLRPGETQSRSSSLTQKSHPTDFESREEEVCGAAAALGVAGSLEHAVASLVKEMVSNPAEGAGEMSTSTEQPQQSAPGQEALGAVLIQQSQTESTDLLAKLVEIEKAQEVKRNDSRTVADACDASCVPARDRFDSPLPPTPAWPFPVYAEQSQSWWSTHEEQESSGQLWDDWSCWHETQLEHEAVQEDDEAAEEELLAALQRTSLPVDNPESIKEVEDLLLDSVLSLYSDRVLPTIGELQARLRWFGCSFAQARCGLALCSRRPDIFRILPPSPAGGLASPPVVLLHSPPPWFAGWITSDTDVDADMGTWRSLEDALRGDCKRLQKLPGCLQQAADKLRLSGMPALQGRTLAETRQLLEFAVGNSRLMYDGHRLRVDRPSPDSRPRRAPKGLRQYPAGAAPNSAQDSLLMKTVATFKKRRADLGDGFCFQ
eukprot:TRINITY_DN26486_c0_g1_i1.p1 TRINITY_DN26486_c0_g1~~TRINITY_DN26486_c0_g1_i1.p1  ORF type:complete len:489 (-),score=88.23 TRINITY_DN26486_c0_g1_i1:67-1416(-)